MTTLISGVAARAVFIEEQQLTYIDADRPEKVHSAPYSSLPLLLAGAPDVEALEGVGYNEALARLLELWSRDRALRMLQIVQGQDEDTEDMIAACEFLNDLIQNEAVYQSVLNVVLAMPAPKGVYLDKLTLIPNAWRNAFELVSLIDELQESVESVREAWDTIDNSEFLSLEHRASFERTAIDKGVFKSLVFAHSGKGRVNDAILQAYIELADEQKSRSILKLWEHHIGVPREKSTIDKIKVEAESEQDAPDQNEALDNFSSVAPYERVKRELKGIRDQLSKRDLPTAKKYLEQLISFQVQDGSSRYAAMSLCASAQYAKSCGYHELALDWVVWATRIAPQDGWAHGQAGDAYLYLHRYNEALESYRKSVDFGEQHFGRCGQARVLRLTYKLEDALVAYRKIDEEFPHHSDAYRVFAGIGEVQRDMGKFEDALETYSQALRSFSDQPVIWCGRAATLKDLSRLDESLETYERAMERFPGEPHAFAGAADTQKLLGHFRQALQLYDDLRTRFSEEPIGFWRIR